MSNGETPVTRRPHFVPVAYLQFFDLTGVPRGRGSQVWATEEGRSFTVGVTNVAVESDLYSRNDPDAAEAFFRVMEGGYRAGVERLLRGETTLNTSAEWALQLSMLHFRNAQYDIEGFQERIEAVEHSTTRFLNEVLLGGTSPPSNEETVGYLRKHWALQVVRATGDRFITSDSPALMFTVGDGEADDIVALMLPVTPEVMVVIRRVDKTEALSDAASEADVGRLNGIQVVASDRFVISADRLDQADQEILGNLKRKFPSREYLLARDRWRPNAFNKYHPGFSFIRW